MQKERTASFYIGEDQWHCTTYPVSEIAKIECQSSYLIRRCYDMWRRLNNGDLPLISRFDPAELLPTNEGGRISFVDTREELSRYELRQFSPKAGTTKFLNPENPFHRHGVLMEILECKETAQPLFQEVWTNINGKEPHKLRLFLPFSDGRGTAATIIVVCCLIPEGARQIADIATIIRLSD